MSKVDDPSLVHMINLVVGDWSRDGHSMSETVTILSNLDKESVEEAYKLGTLKVGFDLTEEVCSDYEDMSVPDDVIRKLKAVGINPDAFIEQDGDQWSFHYDYEAFARLWLRIAELGNSTLRYETTDDESPDINVGGYGLFQ